MFNAITSFKVDHTKLEPGIYLRDEKDNVISWDIRFFKPNTGSYMTPEACHTIEHYMATYFKNVFPDLVYCVCPMGCLTGFYILTKSFVSEKTLFLGMLGFHSYINSENNIPGATEESCGNYKLQDLEGARNIVNRFYNEYLSVTSDSMFANV